MNLFIILSLCFLAWAHQVDPVMGDDEMPIEDQLLSRLVDAVFSMNSSDIRPEITRMSRTQLMKCVTNEQRAVVNSCITSTSQRMGCTGLMMDDDEFEDGETMPMDSSTKKEGQRCMIPMVIECIFQIMGADMTTGLVNPALLKSHIFDTASLTATQKMGSAASLDTCLASDFSMPHRGGNNKTTSAPPGVDTQNFAIVMKAVTCSTKALILNNCGGDPSDAI